MSPAKWTHRSECCCRRRRPPDCLCAWLSLNSGTPGATRSSISQRADIPWRRWTCAATVEAPNRPRLPPIHFATASDVAAVIDQLGNGTSDPVRTRLGSANRLAYVAALPRQSHRRRRAECSVLPARAGSVPGHHEGNLQGPLLLPGILSTGRRCGGRTRTGHRHLAA